tara:strand:- start:318 stop:566 length:249 start_codon:yes stop_codon:yes gene_type:complete
MRRYLVIYTSTDDPRVHSVDLKSDDADRAAIFAKAISRGLDKYIGPVRASSMALDLKSMPQKEARKLFNKLGYDLKIVRISK